MPRKEAPQMEFDIGAENAFTVFTPIGPSNPEPVHRIQSLITFTDIRKAIYKMDEVLPGDTFEVNATIGSAIDWFLVPAQFIYRFRDNYCFDPKRFYTNWNLETVFSNFYPTGWGREKYLSILEDRRKDFVENNPLYPANLALERRNIKRALIPVWKDVAKKFGIDSLEVQEIMENLHGVILPSGKPASIETVKEIGQRIVEKRFDALVEDDKDYTYIAKPRCLFLYEKDGETFPVEAEPDEIKFLRGKQKTTIKRQVVTARIVGDFKDSVRQDLTDYSTAFGKTMLVYNFLLGQIGQKFKRKVTTFNLPNGHVRRFFVIKDKVSKPVPKDRVVTALECLQEEGENIFTPMPRLSKEDEELARSILEKAFLISRQVRI